MLKKENLRPFLKPPTGIGRGHGKRNGDSKALAQTKAELKQTQEKLEQTQAELDQLRKDYDDLMEHVLSVSNESTSSRIKPNSKYSEPTVTNMKSAYDELHIERDFPRVPDLREKLNWSREDFDEMIRDLRDRRIIHLEQADQPMMTKEEWRNCFIDENGYHMGIIHWW